ncbi:MAG: hypothetical protein CML50_11615 [Rhodobacteraceae bacterium]|nr:hypothetical protein [Paracoccaceae bacterium]
MPILTILPVMADGLPLFDLCALQLLIRRGEPHGIPLLSKRQIETIGEVERSFQRRGGCNDVRKELFVRAQEFVGINLAGLEKLALRPTQQGIHCGPCRTPASFLPLFTALFSRGTCERPVLAPDLLISGLGLG